MAQEAWSILNDQEWNMGEWAANNPHEHYFNQTNYL